MTTYTGDYGGNGIDGADYGQPGTAGGRGGNVTVTVPDSDGGLFVVGGQGGTGGYGHTGRYAPTTVDYDFVDANNVRHYRQHDGVAGNGGASGASGSGGDAAVSFTSSAGLSSSLYGTHVIGGDGGYNFYAVGGGGSAGNTYLYPGSDYAIIGGTGGNGAEGTAGARGGDATVNVQNNTLNYGGHSDYIEAQGGNGSGGWSGGAGGGGVSPGNGATGGAGGAGGDARIVYANNNGALPSLYLAATGGTAGSGYVGGEGGYGYRTVFGVGSTEYHGVSGDGGVGGNGGSASIAFNDNTVTGDATYGQTGITLRATGGGGGGGGFNPDTLQHAADGANGGSSITFDNNSLTAGVVSIQIDPSAGGVFEFKGNSFKDSAAHTPGQFSFVLYNTNVPVSVDLSKSSLTVGGNANTLSGFEYYSFNTPAGVTFTGSTAADQVIVTHGNNSVSGGAGNDYIRIDGSAGDTNVIDGGDGDDTIMTYGGNATIAGGKGNDAISIYGGGDNVFTYSGGIALNGYDSIFGSFGFDTVKALADKTVIGIAYINGIELITADGHAGVTIATSYANGTSNLDFSTVTLTGITAINDGAYGDSIIGSAGNDKINGAGGNDTIEGGPGNDSLDGGAGIDTLSYEHAPAGVAISLAVTKAQDTGGAGIDTVKNFENLTGSVFGDHLTGSAKANTIQGFDGDDVITGGGGGDTLYGGPGADLFVFNAATDAKVATPDSILDFMAADGDRIDLHGIDANTRLAGNQAFVIAPGGFTHHAGELFVDAVGVGGGWAVQGDTNGDGLADFLIYVNSPAPLTATDFVL